MSGNASICYAVKAGCRRELVRVDAGTVIVGDAAIMKATFQLAEDGWELVTSDAHPDGGRTLIFRRPKSNSMK